VNVDQAAEFITLNEQTKNPRHLELIKTAYHACREGVKRVHIVDGRVEGTILKEIFSNVGLGTMVYANQHDNIRPMQHTDIAEVLQIMQPAVESDILVPRTAEMLESRINDYVVYEVDGSIHGCGALHPFSGGTAEIAGVAVDETYANYGIGKKIISYLINQAISNKMKNVFVLTTQTSDWFEEYGFKKGALADLPPERQKRYDKSRNSRVLLYPLRKRKSKYQTLTVE
jgi:amino-acid N-acetyltransferase